MLNETLKNHNIILASGSPRRQAFFKNLELDFEIRLVIPLFGTTIKL